MSRTKPKGSISINDCALSLRALVGKAALTQEQAEKVMENFTTVLATKAMARGGDAADAIRNVTQAMQDKLKLNKINASRTESLVVTKYAAIRKFTDQFQRMYEGVDAFLNGSEKTRYRGTGGGLSGRKRAAREIAYGALTRDLAAFDVLKDFHSGRYDEDVLIELHEMATGGRVGLTGNDAANKIAKVLMATYRDAYARLNRAGAVRSMDTNPIRMIHDRLRMLRPDGTIKTKQEAFERWFDFIKPLLDVDKTFNPDFLSDDVIDVKDFMWKTFQMMTDGTTGEGRFNPFIEMQGLGGMARKWSRHNPIYFKDGAGFAKYMREYGVTDLPHTVMHDIDKMVDAYVIMENMSPDPDSVFRQLQSDIMSQIAREPDVKRSEDMRKKLDRGGLRRSFDTLMGRMDTPENMTIQGITSMGQVVTSMAKLPKILLSSIVDRPMAYIGLRHGGVSMQKALEATLMLKPSYTPDEKLAMQAAGLFWEHLLGSIHGRFGTAEVRETTPFKIQQAFFKLTGINHWNSYTRAGTGTAMYAELGENATKTFTELHPDLRRTLEHYDITSAEWDHMRGKTVKMNHRAYILPEEVRKIDPAMLSTSGKDITDQQVALHAVLRERGLEVTLDNVRGVLDSMETKLATYVHDQLDAMVVTPGNRERVQLGFGTRPGTVPGLVIRWAMHFKSFPLATWNRVVKREFYGHGSEGLRDWLMNDTSGKLHMAQLIAFTTLAGYAAQTIDDALNGKTPRRLFEEDGSFNYDTLFGAMRKGGAGGLYMDFLMTEYDRSYNTPLKMAAGPVIDLAQEPILIGWDAIHGKDIGGETAKYIQSNLPFINLFYVKPVLDYLILWNLREMASPGTVRKYENFTEEERHQGFFMRPSETALGL